MIEKSQHFFKIITLTDQPQPKQQHIMFCVKCGLSYKYTGYYWEVIPFRDEAPGSCGMSKEEPETEE